MNHSCGMIPGVKVANWWGEESDEMVPTRAPSRRRILLFSGALAVAVAIWAVVQGTWVPFLVLIPSLLPLGPWRRVVFETRAGVAVWAFVWSGVTFGVLDSLTGDRRPIAGGLFFGAVMGVFQGIVWQKERRKHPSRLRNWLNSRFVSQ